jgi:hypothetical protein
VTAIVSANRAANRVAKGVVVIGVEPRGGGIVSLSRAVIRAARGAVLFPAALRTAAFCSPGLALLLFALLRLPYPLSH